jgi:hypothetical protein
MRSNFCEAYAGARHTDCIGRRYSDGPRKIQVIRLLSWEMGGATPGSAAEHKRPFARRHERLGIRSASPQAAERQTLMPATAS